ncbi:hypothetical protein GE115_03955 [Agromyces sp. CFH 90414]|uniref:Alpha/beta hydrolase n=1 Tax=Agromyces agglutinans TaxID=2662258 RepID=A0A6I2F0Q6_9MICO|nr:hypothetical protein [Agromyces agglutinans]MRG59025.1 hypothetical protein [Agromyces agglutinans]
MSDELTVTTGATTRVVLGDLWQEAARLGAAEAMCADWERRRVDLERDLERDEVIADGVGRWNVDGPTFALRQAGAALRSVHEDSVRLRSALDGAAVAYGDVERSLAAMWDLGTRLSGHLLGEQDTPMTRVGLATLGGLVVPLAIVGAHTGWWDPEAAGKRILADPAFVELVRAAGGVIDEAVMLRLGVPLALALPIGRAIGTSENATLLVGIAAGLGILGNRALVETPVTVTRAPAPKPERMPPPAGVGELARRIPSPDPGEPQVLVERYEVDGERRFIVYIAGTESWSPVPGDAVIDLTSDVHGVADDSHLGGEGAEGSASAAERAVRQALTAAGAQPGDAILPVGYSAGGIAAADLAASPDLAVPLAVTFGSPSSAVHTGEVALLSVEHLEDPVPATGGASHASPGLTTVGRVALGDAAKEDPFAAHALELYRETAAMMDGSEDPTILAFEERIRDFTGGETGELTRWVATREVSPSTDGR